MVKFFVGPAKKFRSRFEPFKMTRGLSPPARLFLLSCVFFSSASFAAEESDYYRIVSVATSEAQTDSRSKNWKPAPDGLALEISGMAVLDDDRLAVAIRKGEVWILERSLRRTAKERDL